MATSYHHGDLPTALRAATDALVAEKRSAGFSLREVVLSPNLGRVAEDTGTSTAPIDVIIDQFAIFMLQGLAAR